MEEESKDDATSAEAACAFLLHEVVENYFAQIGEMQQHRRRDALHHPMRTLRRTRESRAKAMVRVVHANSGRSRVIEIEKAQELEGDVCSSSWDASTVSLVSVTRLKYGKQAHC